LPEFLEMRPILPTYEGHMLKVETRSVEQVLAELRQIAHGLSLQDPRAERIARMIRALEEAAAYRARPARVSPPE
jgi:hypothetical protein